MNKKNLIIGVIILFLLISWTIVYSLFTQKSSLVSKNTIQEKKKNSKKIYKHTFPERLSSSDFFKWEFISNEVASIYPRRDALVRDILVDIWDTVKAGQTLAILFNPWVGWEGQSKINIKSTLLQTKRNLLWNIKEVKNAKISEILTKIIEKEIILDETSKNFDAKINQLNSLEKNKTLSEDFSIKNSQTKIDIEKNNLSVLEQSLEDAISLKQEIISESEKNISQKKELLQKSIDDILSKIIPMFFIWEESNIDYNEIKRWDISYLFWAKNSINRNLLLQKINNFILKNKDEEKYILEKYKELLEINKLLIISLQNTVISVDIEESKIKNSITAIQGYEIILLNYKEIYDDSINSNRIISQSQEEKISKLKTQIQTQKSVILWAESWYNLISSLKNEKITDIEESIKKLKSDKSLSVNKLKAELVTLKKTKKLLEAQENQKITSINNDILVAKSNLNSEYIKSWDYKIISPFSWIISKRTIEIWAKISSNKEAFRVTWVKNSLSKITKKEIKFFVPESLKQNIELNKEITFYFWNEKNQTFTWSIYRISPEVDANNFSILVQAKISDTINFPNKSTVRVWFKTEKNIFKVPSKSIYNKWKRKIIYYKKDNWKIWVRDINIISEDWEFYLISGEIDEKLKIVTTPIFIK